MNQSDITQRLKAVKDKSLPTGLTDYVVQSIECGEVNYTVSNLLQYCNDFNVKMIMKDLTTEDCFYPAVVMDVHEVLGLLMDRYNVDSKLVYRKTAIHYTAPKNGVAPLSIRTLLAVCEVIHCDLIFEVMKSSVE